MFVKNPETELLTLERGNRDTEIWLAARKVGFILGDVEDIVRRKHLK